MSHHPGRYRDIVKDGEGDFFRGRTRQTNMGEKKI
jgi:hypothetical protein